MYCQPRVALEKTVFHAVLADTSKHGSQLMEVVMQQTEDWKPVPSCPGYEASSLGGLRSIDRVIITGTGPRSYKGG